MGGSLYVSIPRIRTSADGWDAGSVEKVLSSAAGTQMTLTQAGSVPFLSVVCVCVYVCVCTCACIGIPARLMRFCGMVLSGR